MSARGQFLNDLYRDLRDRRLLPVVIALGVAILAVPLFLKSKAEAPPPALAPAATGTSEAAPPPAVLVDAEGVRDYRKRLKLLHSKNPFEAKFAPQAVGEGVELEDVSGSGSGGSTSVTIEEPSSSPSGSDTSSGGSSGVTSSEPTGGGSSGSGDGEPKVRFYSSRVDVEVGPKGNLKSYEGIKRMTVLPGAANPVTILLGVTEDAGKAVFLLSGDVTGTTGEGSCLPSAAECTYLTLKEGERREIVYAPDGEGAVTYMLELTKIDVVRVKDPRKKSTEKRAHSAQAPSGGVDSLGFAG